MTSDQITTAPVPEAPKPTCPECGAEIRDPRAARCWLCREPLTPGPRASEDLARRIRAPELVRDSPAWAVIGVLGLLVLGGLMFAEALGVLIVLLILATPALVRTVGTAARRRHEGAPADAVDVLTTFLSSLGVVVVAGLASFSAFWFTCLAVSFGMMGVDQVTGGRFDNMRGLEYLLWISAGVGCLVGMVLFVLILRRLWPRKG